MHKTKVRRGLSMLSPACAGEPSDMPISYLQKTVRHAGVEASLAVNESSQASVVSSVDSQHYHQLKAAILATFSPPQASLPA